MHYSLVCEPLVLPECPPVTQGCSARGCGTRPAVNPSRNCSSTQLGRPRLHLRRKKAVELGEVLLREVQVESPAVVPDVIERRRSRYGAHSRLADQPRERDLSRCRAMALGHAPQGGIAQQLTVFQRRAG